MATKKTESKPRKPRAKREVAKVEEPTQKASVLNEDIETLDSPLMGGYNGDRTLPTNADEITKQALQAELFKKGKTTIEATLEADRYNVSRISASDYSRNEIEMVVASKSALEHSAEVEADESKLSEMEALSIYSGNLVLKNSGKFEGSTREYETNKLTSNVINSMNDKSEQAGNILYTDDIRSATLESQSERIEEERAKEEKAAQDALNLSPASIENFSEEELQLALLNKAKARSANALQEKADKVKGSNHVASMVTGRMITGTTKNQSNKPIIIGKQTLLKLGKYLNPEMIKSYKAQERQKAIDKAKVRLEKERIELEKRELGL